MNSTGYNSTNICRQGETNPGLCSAFKSMNGNKWSCMQTIFLNHKTIPHWADRTVVWDILTFSSARLLWNLIKSKLPQWLRGLRSSMKTTTVVSQSMERFIWFSLAVLYKYYFIPKLKLFLQSVVVVVLSRITLLNNIWLDLLGFLSSLWSEDARGDLLAPPWSWSSPPG